MEYSGMLDACRKYAPLLVHHDSPEKHFALVLAADPEWVVTVDPARGAEIVSRAVFEDRWSGVVLVTASRDRSVNSGRLEAAVETTVMKKALLEKRSW
jgi:ABC-type bacteriocin/lantibiotic exporter with double-glycine peptidase domain